MISAIERGESSPTAHVLDKLAAGLNVSMASLFADDPEPNSSPLSRRDQQRQWKDPATGYVRRNLSPAKFPSAIELAEVLLPPKTSVAFEPPAGRRAYDQQIFVIEGRIEVRMRDAVHALAAGDCLAMRVDEASSFRNPLAKAARYLVATAPTRRQSSR